MPEVPLLAAGLALAGGLILAYLIIAKSKDTREPPEAPSTIPVIGHVLGLMRSKFNYYVELRQRTTTPIFTVSMPGQKMYIITAPELIQSVQKLPKILAFPPIEAKFTKNVCGISAEANRILDINTNGEDGDWGLSMESHAGMRSWLAPGPALDEINRGMMSEVAETLDALLPMGTTSKRLLLVDWLRQSITLATTNAVYGPHNPFLQKSVYAGFWAFETRLMALILAPLPSLFARQGVSARTTVARAFHSYLCQNHHLSGSTLVRSRVDVSSRNGVPLEDTARFEVGLAIAVLVNTTPAAFWMLFFVHSMEGLLDELREEISTVVTSKADESGRGEVRNLDITRLKTECPLLASTFQEVLRYRSMGTSVREVMEETLLDNRWLLKKGCMIQMPSRVVHTDASIWGSDVNSLNPRRFLKNLSDSAPKPGAAQRARAFRGFGGGTTLCPGRHFATNEVLALVAMFIMRFDMVPVSGAWAAPTSNNTNVAAVLMEPDSDIEVEISRRQGTEGVRWTFSLEESGKVFAVAAEDREEA